VQGLVDILSHFGSVAGNGGVAELRLPVGKICCSDGQVDFIPKPPHGQDAGFSRPSTHLPAFSSSSAAAATNQEKRPLTSDVAKLRSIIGYKGTHLTSSRPLTGAREALQSMSSSIISSSARAALVATLPDKHDAARKSAGAAQRGATAGSNKSEDLFGMDQPSRHSAASSGQADRKLPHSQHGRQPTNPGSADLTWSQNSFRQMNARQQVLRQGFDMFEAKAAQVLAENARVEAEMEAQRQRAIQAEKLAAQAKELKQRQDRAYLQTQIVDLAHRKKKEWEFNTSVSGNGMGKSIPGGETVLNRDLRSSMRARELSQEYLAQIELKKRLKIMQRDKEADFERQVCAKRRCASFASFCI
jgi:hypothetical protein